MKRIISILLVLAMLCAFGTVFAQEEAPAEETAAGENIQTVPEEVVQTAPEETPAAETAEQPAGEEAQPDAGPAEDGTEAAVYTVSFDANGGTGAPDAQTKTAGQPLTLSDTVPVRVGYTFLGWAADSAAAAADYAAGGSYADDADTTLYAVWQYSAVTISSSKSYTAKITEAGGKVYYAFTPSSSLNYVIYSTGTADTAVTLYSADGTVLASDDNSGDDNNFRLAYAMKKGQTYLFGVGYADASDAGSIALKFGRAYTIRFDANGGSGAPASQVKDYGRTLTLSDTIPARSGYTFLGWAASSTAETAAYQAGGAYTANGNATLYAVWAAAEEVIEPVTMASSRTYTAKITAAGGQAYYDFTPTSSKTYVLCSTGTASADVTLYDEDGAELGSSSGEDFRISYAMTAGRTYRFVIIAAEAGSIGFTFGRAYTIKFDANGGSGAPASQVKDYGRTLTLSDTIPVRSGYTFLGWAASSTAETAAYQAGGAYTANGNVTLYAVWQSAVTALASGRSCTADITTAGGRAYYSFTPTSSKTYVLYSVGTEDTVVTMYDEDGAVLACDDNSGESNNFRLAYVMTAGKTYLFEVGYADEGEFGSIELNFGRVYTVKYNANGGSGAPASQTKDYGNVLTITSAEPTRSGYTFLGWAASSTAETAAYTAGDDYAANGNVTLYAVWREGDDPIYSGTCGENVTWRLDTLTGVLTIRGEGAMDDYSDVHITIASGSDAVIEDTSDTAPWYEYRDAVKSVVVKSGVQAIGSYAFYNCAALEEAAIAESVRAVGGHAFCNCTALASVTIPAGVTEIDGYAFYNCTGLTSLTIPAGVTEIGDRTCYGCRSLQSVTLPEGLRVIGIGAFYNCTSLAQITIPAGVQTICSSAFVNCRALTSVTLPEGVQTIGSGAFSGCTGLTEMTLPEGVQTIGSSAFYACTGLTEITLPEGVQTIGDSAFYNCSGLTSVTIPESVVSIGTWAFYIPGTGGAASGTDLDADDTSSPLKDLYIRGDVCAFGSQIVRAGSETVIHGCAGSTAQVFAIENSLTFRCLEHTWDAGVLTAVPTAETAGERTRTCTVCGETGTETIPTAGKLASSKAYTAVIGEAGGTVCYTYTPDTSRTYVLYSTGSEDTWAVLYDADGTLLASADHGGSGDNFRLAYAMTAGRTYVFVVSYADETASGSIALRFGRVYTVKYNANGGSGAPEAQTKDYGSAMTISDTIPVRGGYTFLGWAADSTAEAAAYKAGGSYTGNGNVTLYAVWEKTENQITELAANRSYTAAVAAGGTAYYTFTPTSGQTYVLYSAGSEDTKVTLYDGDGAVLASDDNSGEDGNFRLAYVMTAGRTYMFAVSYADGTRSGSIALKFGRVYTVKYNANGGTGAPASQKKDYGSAMTISDTIPVRGGYIFLGWAASSTAGTAAYAAGGSYTANGNATLYAVWMEYSDDPEDYINMEWSVFQTVFGEPDSSEYLSSGLGDGDDGFHYYADYTVETFRYASGKEIITFIG